MLGHLSGSLADLAVVLVLLLVSGALVAAGIAVELVASSHLLAGDLYLALWEVAFGLILLYAGAVALGYREVLPRLRTLVTA